MKIYVLHWIEKTFHGSDSGILFVTKDKNDAKNKLTSYAFNLINEEDIENLDVTIDELKNNIYNNSEMVDMMLKSGSYEIRGDNEIVYGDLETYHIKMEEHVV